MDRKNTDSLKISLFEEIKSCWIGVSCLLLHNTFHIIFKNKFWLSSGMKMRMKNEHFGIINVSFSMGFLKLIFPRDYLDLLAKRSFPGSFCHPNIFLICFYGFQKINFFQVSNSKLSLLARPPAARGKKGDVNRTLHFLRPYLRNIKSQPILFGFF